jgi:hypothetical protein
MRDAYRLLWCLVRQRPCLERQFIQACPLRIPANHSYHRDVKRKMSWYTRARVVPLAVATQPFAESFDIPETPAGDLGLSPAYVKSIGVKPSYHVPLGIQFLWYPEWSDDAKHNILCEGGIP